MNLRAFLTWVGRSSRRIGVTVVGGALAVAGLAGLVFPVIPGIPLLLIGLAILATEYAWARSALEETKRRARGAARRLRRKRG